MSKISCLMVTKRLDALHTLRAIESFKNQTYKDKELIIVYSHSSNDQIYKIQEFVSDIECTMYNIMDSATLGEARNISIDLAKGEWVCQWDDDDISHMDRLLFQHEWNVNNNAEASIFSAQYHLFEHEKNMELYLENRKSTSSPEHNGWCGTIMALKNVMKNIYPYMKIDEDTKGLSKLKNLKIIKYDSIFYHYIYSYHGNNTWDLEHNRYMVGENNGNVKSNPIIKAWINDNFNIKI